MQAKTNLEKINNKTKPDDNLKEIVALCKRRGFVFPGSEIYGGLSNTYDYGPMGVELLRNLKNEWWKTFVSRREDILGLDSSIMLHPKVWEASGHLTSFNDPLIDCKNCKIRFRADQYLEEKNIITKGLNLTQIKEIFKTNIDKFTCSTCGNKNSFTEVRQFNLMFSTKMGSVENEDELIYLRPETAQGIFINFKNILDSSRVKIPFGIAQIGKSFRNEIVARQFIFRTREFEQLEMEYFCKPGTQKEFFDYWLLFCKDWLEEIGLSKENIRIRKHEKSELSFYSDKTADIEFQYPFGWGELWGIASRTNYDLNQHSKYSNKSLEYFDNESNEHFTPYVIEPALGLNRLFLAVLCNAFNVENPGKKEQRIYLKLDPKIAPIKVGIFPLQKKDGLYETALKIYKNLSQTITSEFDSSGSIGKRYYRQDELGTPFCITIDYQTKEDQTVTLRYRDDGRQERLKISNLKKVLFEKLNLNDSKNSEIII